MACTQSVDKTGANTQKLDLYQHKLSYTKLQTFIDNKAIHNFLYSQRFTVFHGNLYLSARFKKAKNLQPAHVIINDFDILAVIDFVPETYQTLTSPKCHNILECPSINPS